MNQPPLGAKLDHRCEDCARMRKRRPTDPQIEGGHKNDTHWCPALNLATMPLLFRCGGDDFEEAYPAKK
jgi:hypothetical protein